MCQFYTFLLHSAPLGTPVPSALTLPFLLKMVNNSKGWGTTEGGRLHTLRYYGRREATHPEVHGRYTPPWGTWAVYPTLRYVRDAHHPEVCTGCPPPWGTWEAIPHPEVHGRLDTPWGMRDAGLCTPGVWGMLGYVHPWVCWVYTPPWYTHHVHPGYTMVLPLLTVLHATDAGCVRCAVMKPWAQHWE